MTIENRMMIDCQIFVVRLYSPVAQLVRALH